jgi:CHC2-type zinc finger protein
MPASSHQSGGCYQFDLDDIRRRVSVRDYILHHLNWKDRHRGRCDCGLCKGSSNGTLAFTANQYCCHRCHSGGDVFTLHQAIHCCSFADAVKALAAIAGVSASEVDRRQLDESRTERARQAQAALELRRGIRDLRFQYREEIHFCERIIREMRERLNDPNEPSRECCGSVLVMVLDDFRESLSAYYLLAFGMEAEQEEFFRNPEWRPLAIRGVLTRGLVRDDQGHVMEVSLP